MQAVSDEQLIQWVADGDASCLGTLFERHHRGVYQYCLQLTRSPAVSEDLVQDVFLKLLQKAASYRGEGSCKAWIFNIARNVTFDYLRRADRRGYERRGRRERRVVSSIIVRPSRSPRVSRTCGWSRERWRKFQPPRARSSGSGASCSKTTTTWPARSGAPQALHACGCTERCSS